MPRGRRNRAEVSTRLALLVVCALLAPDAGAQRIDDARALRVAGEQLAGFRLLHGDSPDQHYPEAARRAALDGFVSIDVMINEAGQVLEAQVITESPQGKGFGIAALDAAKTFEFENPLKRWVVFTLNIEFLP